MQSTLKSSSFKFQDGDVNGSNIDELLVKESTLQSGNESYLIDKFLENKLDKRENASPATLTEN